MDPRRTSATVKTANVFAMMVLVDTSVINALVAIWDKHLTVRLAANALTTGILF
jgi:hypothetical protein